jgi:hypothetical protein
METSPENLRAAMTGAYLIAADMEDVLAKIADAAKALILISMAKGFDGFVAAAVHGLADTITTATDQARQMSEQITKKTWAHCDNLETASDLPSRRNPDVRSILPDDA